MLFKDFHIWPMFKGIKTYTRRTWKTAKVKVGGTYPVTHKMFYTPEDIVGWIHVEDLYRQPLGCMTEKDAFYEGGYDLPSYFKVLNEVNKSSISTSEVTWVVKFRFALADTIDPNGGTAMMDDYFTAWKNHMARYKIDVTEHLISFSRGE